MEELKINEQSIKTELKEYENSPFNCLCEYIWNAFDANAKNIVLSFDIPADGLGYVSNVKLKDDGNGWDFSNIETTNTFISSTKEPQSDKTLPRGHYGRGRYAFIWICQELNAYSQKQKLTLKHSTLIEKTNDDLISEGTLIEFRGINEKFSSLLQSEQLKQFLICEYGWFLKENSKLKIIVNGETINPDSNIKKLKTYGKENLPQDLSNEVDNEFWAEIVIWNNKPSEYSKFYFLDKEKNELKKINTGMNKKKDEFWHSVYIISSLYYDDPNSVNNLDEESSNLQIKIPFGTDSERKKITIRNKIKKFLKQELINLRKPYLVENSNDFYYNLKENKLIPDLQRFGIYDNVSFEQLIKTIYVITPSLFVGKNDSERKFLCTAFAGLLSTEDNELIKVVLEQLQELSEEEKQELLEILHRTTLSNIIKTIKEVDHRLEVINSLKSIIFENKKETLEVKHIQKILDENFWIFGEQFRLFSTTEGPLHKTLMEYAKKILNIENATIETDSKKELDLFLTKQEVVGDNKQKNIIVELKRPSITLGKKEYDQLETYMETIMKEDVCNGENQSWEFYLIGNDYDEHILNKIDSSANHGERERGLCQNNKNGKIKIYVRKWSDILEVEWSSKMQYLKEKLQIQAKKLPTSSEQITENILRN